MRLRKEAIMWAWVLFEIPEASSPILTSRL
jgi:hypothetical protein